MGIQWVSNGYPNDLWLFQVSWLCLSKLVPLSSHWLPACLQMKIPAHRDTRLPTVTSLATAKLPPEQMPATAQQPDSIRLLLHATTASPASLHMVPIGFHPTSPPSTSGLDIETRVSASVDESRAHKLQYSGCPFPNYSPTSRTPLQDTCPRFTTWANTHTSNNLGPPSTTSRISALRYTLQHLLRAILRSPENEGQQSLAGLVAPFQSDVGG